MPYDPYSTPPKAFVDSEVVTHKTLNSSLSLATSFITAALGTATFDPNDLDINSWIATGLMFPDLSHPHLFLARLVGSTSGWLVFDHVDIDQATTVVEGAEIANDQWGTFGTAWLGVSETGEIMGAGSRYEEYSIEIRSIAETEVDDPT